MKKNTCVINQIKIPSIRVTWRLGGYVDSLCNLSKWQLACDTPGYIDFICDTFQQNWSSGLDVMEP